MRKQMCNGHCVSAGIQRRGIRLPDVASGRRGFKLGGGMRRSGAWVTAFVALMLAVAGCGSSSAPHSSSKTASFYTGGTPGGTPVRGGVATLDEGQAIKNLQPIELVESDEIAVTGELFDQLVEYLPGSREAQPGLAESWSISPNGLTYTFHIRPHVEFSNGEPLTAEDVAFSLLLQKRPTAILGPPLKASTWKVSVVDPLTVKLQLQKPFSGLISYLGGVQLSIVPKRVFEREGVKGFGVHPIGTGPFMLKSATPTYSNVTMVRNPHYWRVGQPYLDGLVFNEVTETNARILAVRTGAATIATGISFSQVANLQKTAGVRMLVSPLQTTDPLFFNDGVAPFNNVNVRKALNYATPRQEIIKAVFKGLGEPANDPIGHLKYWDSSVPAFSFDLAKAKALLKESPVPNGFSATLIVLGGEPDAELVASILQSTWAQIGVHITLKTQEPSTFYATVVADKYQMAITSDEGFVTEEYAPDVSALLNFDYPDSGTHSDDTYFNSPRVTALLRRATTSQNEAERSKLFGEVQELVVPKEAADDAIAELPSRTLVSASLHGFQVLPTNTMRLEQAWLAK